MSQTLTYDQSGTDSSAAGKIYDLDFFPGAEYDLAQGEIDQNNLNLNNMLVYIVTYTGRTIQGEYKKESQSWGQGTAFTGVNVINEEDVEINQSTSGKLKTLQLSGLDQNTKYDFRVRSVSSSNGAVYGNYVYATFTTFYPIGLNGIARIQSFTNPSLLAPVISDQVVNKDINNMWTPWNYEENKEFWSETYPVQEDTLSLGANSSGSILLDHKKISGSVFTINNPFAIDGQTTLAVKGTGIDLQYGSPTYYPASNPPVVYPQYKHFTFGTKLFFSEWKDKVDAPQGGIGFFLNPSGSSGYAVVVKTTQSNVGTDNKEVNTDVSIVKIESTNKFKRLPDSQGNLGQSFSGITSAEEYVIDLKVNCGITSNLITVYINGRAKIVAEDSVSPLQPTKNIGLFTMKGECNFDYVYAYPLYEDQYDSLELDKFTAGRAPFSALSIAYGNKVVNKNSQEYNGYYEEFGTTAKELMVIEEKFTTQTPGYAKFLSTGINKYVEVLAQKSNNFGFKAYVINNSSTTVPLSDPEQQISFFMIGNSVITGEKSEYNTVEPTEYVNDEFIILESTWIQRKSDAEKMANWLKEQWSKNSVFLQLQVFGNPFVAVGDIITVSYPRSGITDSQKFLVTAVEQSFDGGLETVLGCRSINSYS